MRNIVGQIPRGDDFFPRDGVINRIYRRLDSGNNLYLSAPRRVGKTSIMMSLNDNPREGYLFVYLNVEDCVSANDYFKVLADTLKDSLEKGHFSRLGEKAKGALNAFLERVKKIKISVFEVETNTPAPDNITYIDAFESLLRDIDAEGTVIVIMVDEFPVAVENIAQKQGNEAAIHFLHANRGMRQRAAQGIRFVYTGSIGLPNVARKLSPDPVINDLNIVEIPPLTLEEGLEMSRLLFAHYEVIVNDDCLRYMLEQIQWLMPFFIQLTIQLLIDENESTGKSVSPEMVDNILQKASNHRNNSYLASYYDRLTKTLPEGQSSTAKLILAQIAQKGSAAATDFNQDNALAVLDTLEYDGYIHLFEEQYRFNSPILQRWWLKNARL